MKIGKSSVPRTAICTSDEHTIVVRGQDLCKDLIGHLSFTDYFFLLLTGKRPDAACSAVLNATLVAIAEHGLVPSVQASRMTYAAAPDALQGAVAAGILGCGSVILGASETAGRLFADIAARVDAGEALDDVAASGLTLTSYCGFVDQFIADHPGYAHLIDPEHPGRPLPYEARRQAHGSASPSA